MIHSPETELFIVGVIVGCENALLRAKLFSALEPRDFNSPQTKIAFEISRYLYQSSKPIDLLTMKENGADPIVLIEAMGDASTYDSGYVMSKVMLLKEYAMKRQFVDVLAEARDKYITSSTYDVFDAIDKLRSDVSSIAPNSSRFAEVSTAEELEKVRQEALLSAAAKSQDIIRTGFGALDALIGGVRLGDLVVVASRPSMGKTAFSLSLALNQIEQGVGVGFFSLEMSRKALLVRALSQIASIDSKRLRFATLSDYERMQMQEKMDNTPHVFELLPIDDDGGMTIERMRARLDQWRLKHNVKVVVVDYLQLVESTSKTDNREQQIGAISRGLKRLAKEFNVVMISLAQLNRQAENAERPRLSHLRESGAIEQDADIVAFLYRPSYYGIKEYQSGQSTEGIGEVIIAKNREGEVGVARLGFAADKTKWYDLDEHPEERLYDPFNGED